LRIMGARVGSPDSLTTGGIAAGRGGAASAMSAQRVSARLMTREF
jgi:hypothetical protein